MKTRAAVVAFVLVVCGAASHTDAQQSPTILITGSNRGLGLEFVKQYAAAGWTCSIGRASRHSPPGIAAARSTSSSTTAACLAT